MLHLLRDLQRRAPVRFELVAVNIDQGHPGYPGRPPARLHARRGLRLHDDRGGHLLDRHREDPRGKDVLLALLAPAPRHPLSRRAASSAARRSRSATIATTSSQTLLLNLFFAGQLAAMPPKLVSRRRRNVVIRPLAYCAEEDIAASPRTQAFPILPCDLCGSQDNLQRKIVGGMLDELERDASRHQERDARRAAERPPEPPARQGPLAHARSRGGRERGGEPGLVTPRVSYGRLRTATRYADATGRGMSDRRRAPSSPAEPRVGRRRVPQRRREKCPRRASRASAPPRRPRFPASTRGRSRSLLRRGHAARRSLAKVAAIVGVLALVTAPLVEGAGRAPSTRTRRDPDDAAPRRRTPRRSAPICSTLRARGPGRRGLASGRCGASSCRARWSGRSLRQRSPPRASTAFAARSVWSAGRSSPSRPRGPRCAPTRTHAGAHRREHARSSRGASSRAGTASYVAVGVVLALAMQAVGWGVAAPERAVLVRLVTVVCGIAVLGATTSIALARHATRVPASRRLRLRRALPGWSCSRSSLASGSVLGRTVTADAQAPALEVSWLARCSCSTLLPLLLVVGAAAAFTFGAIALARASDVEAIYFLVDRRRRAPRGRSARSAGSECMNGALSVAALARRGLSCLSCG